ncbi:MAG TPA: tetratricopeptide repeat protein [Dissulfurispiraceae bacterium]|nr:tetratricopeptide repeat protein [Dissulfurispiraceae bacterium]
MKKYLLLVAVLCCSLMVGCAARSGGVDREEGKDAEFYKKIGISFMSEGRNQLAFVEFQKALKLQPNDADTLYYIGLVYMSFDEVDNAITHFSRAVALRVDFSEAANSLGEAYLRAKKYNEAVSAFQKALANRFYKTPEHAMNNLGTAYYRLGKLDDALASYKMALRRNPSFIAPYLGIALANNKAGQFGEASDALGLFIDIDPTLKGDREKMEESIRMRLVAASGDEEQDLRDFLEILKY